MKKICLAGVVLSAVLLTGCVSMILAQYKEHQPCNFEILPPAQTDFVIMLPDDTLKSNVIGKWCCDSSVQSYLKLDMNNEPFIYKNVPNCKSTSTYIFKADGTLDGKVVTETLNTRTNQRETKTMKQSGRWECKNGVFTLHFLNEKNGKVYSVPAVATWKTADSMQLRFDTESFEKMVLDTIRQDAKLPKGSSIDGYQIYYDKNGNFYNILKNSSVSGSYHIKCEVIMKSPAQIFSRIK